MYRRVETDDSTYLQILMNSLKLPVKILKNKDQVQSFQMTPCLTPVLTSKFMKNI